MIFFKSIYDWVIENYVKVILFITTFVFLYGIYFYYTLSAQKRDQETGDAFLKFYSSYSELNFDEEEYLLAFNKISKINEESIYLAMLKSLRAAEFINKNEKQEGLLELVKAKEILSNKGEEFNFLKEIVNLRIISILIDLEDLDRAKNLLKDDFIIYRANKLIFEGDILALENKFQDAKKSFKEALMISENETQKNIINLKISALTE
tara:strand:- start:24 stop:647 length:624 start_codon:yes stop_codon:yes gene_type:complete